MCSLFFRLLELSLAVLLFVWALLFWRDYPAVMVACDGGGEA